MSNIGLTICLSTNADATVKLEITEEKLTELLGGERFDPQNTCHKDVIEEFFFGSNTDLPSICAQCSGWGRDFSLSIGDDWEIIEIFRAGDDE